MTYVQWRKSSFSGSSSNCVEIALVPKEWRKSAFSSAQGNCVELAEHDDVVLVRNSNDPDAGTLTLGQDTMAVLIADMKAGALDQHA